MMYLNADHSGLNKFSGHDDPDFRNVLAVIDEMAKDAEGIIKQNHVGKMRREVELLSLPGLTYLDRYCAHVRWENADSVCER